MDTQNSNQLPDVFLGISFIMLQPAVYIGDCQIKVECDVAGMSMDRKPSIDRTLDLGLLRFAVCGLLFAWKTALVFLFTLLIIASRMGGCNASACRTYHTAHSTRWLLLLLVGQCRFWSWFCVYVCVVSRQSPVSCLLFDMFFVMAMASGYVFCFVRVHVMSTK